ncbi:hypothetical protein ABZ897_23710 [Nonomuraea sp. NPDC046802]|uniref:FAS1-like dehydratase domain-containing protein n=1 Tax=Nonomuraea sp. NPDC046802 TaxID=3154919 RepID=UPI0033E2A326
MSLADHVRDWRPAPDVRVDDMGPAPVRALARTLDRPEVVAEPGAALPPLWHWLYFLDWPAQSELAEDGHLVEGDFLPPVPGRRRMFAGGRLRVHAPLLLGRPAVRTASLAGVTAKTGRSGELLFVTVRTEYRQDDELRLVEEQDLVYRSHLTRPTSPAPSPAYRSHLTLSFSPAPSPVSPTGRGQVSGRDGTGEWRIEMTADARLLFRFSALTANTHRIHYDQDYVRNVEGHPGLIVHGPLLAVLMAELPRRHAPDRPVASMTYRFRRPVLAGEPVLITGDPRTGRLSVGDLSGDVRAEAEVAFAP